MDAMIKRRRMPEWVIPDITPVQDQTTLFGWLVNTRTAAGIKFVTDPDEYVILPRLNRHLLLDEHMGVIPVRLREVMGMK